MFSSKEEDTPPRRNLGGDQQIAVNKKTMTLMLLDSRRGVALFEYQKASNSAAVFAT
jgi:hypothetical protein